MKSKPRYLKKKGVVLKVLSYNDENPNYFYSDNGDSGEDNIHLIKEFEPATKKEYLNYINSISKQ